MKMFIIKRFIYLFSLIGIIWFSYGCDHHMFEPDEHNRGGYDNDVRNSNYFESESFSYSMSAGRQTRLTIKGINGNITLIGKSGSDSVIIFGEKKVGSESVSDAREHLRYLSVNVQNYSNEILAITTQPDDAHGRNYTVNYYVYLPDNYEVYTDNVNGIIKIESINNFVKVSNVNGEVRLSNINGATNISIVNGTIQCKQYLPLNAAAQMNMVNGNIYMDIPTTTSAEVTASVVIGDISTSNLAFSKQFKTINSLSGSLGGGYGKIKLNTVNGRIVITGF